MGAGTSASTSSVSTGGTTTTASGSGAGTTSSTTSGSSSSGIPMNCTEITVGAFTAGQADGTASEFAATPLPNQGDMTEADAVSLEFYGSAFDPSDNGEKTGTFDLSMGGDDNYATCSRCLSLFVDPSVPGKTFFQVAGTIVIDATSDQINGTVSATLTNVTLVEVTVDSSTFTSTPVAGGACLHLATASVMAAPVPPPAGWLCTASFYNDGTCDCGCGVADSDCTDATVGSCDVCNDTGSCSTADCPGTINATNNAVCTP
jgi:hypothetical protein